MPLPPHLWRNRESERRNKGSTPALGDAQARGLLEASPLTRSRACATAPSSYHGLRREELCGLRVKDKRFAKRQQMQWAPHSAHLLLQTRTRALDGTLRPLFERWHPGLAVNNPACESDRAAA